MFQAFAINRSKCNCALAVQGVERTPAACPRRQKKLQEIDMDIFHVQGQFNVVNSVELSPKGQADFLLSSKCALKTSKRLCFCSQILRRLGLLRFLHFNMCVLYTYIIYIHILMCVISLLFGFCIVFVTSASCLSMSSVVLVSHLR